MTVEEAPRTKPRASSLPLDRAGRTERPRVHELATDTVSQIEAALADVSLAEASWARVSRPRLRIAAAGGPSDALSAGLASLITVDAAALADESPADVLLICPETDDDELLGANLSAFGRECSAIAAAAVPGQLLIMTSTTYVGCVRDLLVAPLTARGLVVGRDIHVAISPEPDPESPHGTRLVGGATPACVAAAAAVLERAGHVTSTRTLEDAEAASLTSHGPGGVHAAAKRAIDILGAAAGLIILAPVMALIAVAVALDSPGPVLFRQDRVGRSGRLFRFRKFRTMTDGAEQRLHEVIHLNGIKGPGFQIDSDPRVTRIGRLLRRASLDELPELWSVLRGDMSLVGPRPAPLVEVAAYKPWHRRRLGVKPGLTGLAQVRARKYREFDVKAGLDLQYIDHWSLWLDVRIILETVPAVLRFTGR